MAVLSGMVDLNETRKAVENAEKRASLQERKSDSRIGRRNNREHAQALHREADKLYRCGDYESALVLYHRAANLFPRDSSHSVAARRTTALISSCNNPTKSLRKALPSANNGERLTVTLCPETAAMLANDKLKKMPDPSSISQVLKYFDSHKTFWKTLPSPRPSNLQLTRRETPPSNQQQADRTLTDLQATFNSGRMNAALKLVQDLLNLSSEFHDPSRYQIAAYHYLSLIYVALGRHDRAVSSVSRLVRLSKSTEDEVRIYRSLVTLGKVHLSFGHLDAAAKAWEHLSKDLKEAIPVAWIRHEIGRCYLETGKYQQASEMAIKSIDAAVKGKSKKWLLYGKLLLGVSLAKLGRFVEALEELQVAAKITEEEGDTPMLSYIRDLIDQLETVLRTIPFENDPLEPCKPTTISSSFEQVEKPAKRPGVYVSREQTVITTMFTKRMITEYQDGSSSDASLNEEITMHSEKESSPKESYRETTERSELNEQQDESVSRDEATYRKEGPAEGQSTGRDQTSSFSSASSSSSIIYKLEEEEEDVEEDNADIQDEERAKCSNSKVSLRSTNTTATYVIERGEPIEESKLDNDVKKGITRLIDKVNEDEASRSDKTLNRDYILDDGYVREVMDKVGRMKDMELVMLLKERLLEENWTSDFRESGDSNRDDLRRSRLDKKN